MIGDVLDYIRQKLNSHLVAGEGGAPPAEDQVVFAKGENMDPVQFKLGAITLLISNVEQDNLLRDADPFRRRTVDGKSIDIYPDVRLNILALFVCHYTNYKTSLDNLSKIISFFQKAPVYNRQNNQDLPSTVEKIGLELVTLPHSELNEVWGALRTSYHPSVIYRIRTVIFQDQGQPAAKPIEEQVIHVNMKN